MSMLSEIKAPSFTTMAPPGAPWRAERIVSFGRYGASHLETCLSCLDMVSSFGVSAELDCLPVKRVNREECG
jgi:hypothetical protein